MHPILLTRTRMLVYLAIWVAFGLLLAGVLMLGGRAPMDWSLEFAVPLAVLLGLQALPYWYLVRALPPDTTPPHRILLIWIGAALVSLAIWLGLAYEWAQLLLPTGASYPEGARAGMPILGFVGGIAITLAVLGNYLMWAFQRSREAERRALELQVLAREAELKSLRAQLDPHFLFNSLNSVAALIGNDTQAARHMCFLIAQFFRKSLTLGRQEAIPLSEEVGLAQTFLAIEKVRFGDDLVRGDEHCLHHALAAALQVMQHAQFRVQRFLRRQHRAAVVAGVVIDIDHFVRHPTTQRCGDLGQQRRDVVALVEHGDDDGELRHRAGLSAETGAARGGERAV